MEHRKEVIQSGVVTDIIVDMFGILFSSFD